MTNEDITNLKNNIDVSIQRSECGISRLNSFLMPTGDGEQVPFASGTYGWAGMSSTKGRHMFNNVCRALGSIKKVKYLEIGTWAGSTLLSTLFGNGDKMECATAIDNFSQFQENHAVRQSLEGGLIQLFGESGLKKQENGDMISNLGDFRFNFFESHCFELDKKRLSDKYNFYFFDGPHSYEDTKKGFTYYNDVLEDYFVVLIDDWNRDYVKKAWEDVSEELKYTIHHEWNLYGAGGIEDNPNHKEDWWDGYYVAIVSKENSDWWGK
jgi:hypothetical protein